MPGIKKIALDIRGLTPGFKSHFGRGTGRYIKELTREFKNIEHKGIEFTELSQESVQLSPLQSKILSISPLGKTTLECQIFFPRNIQKLNPDLVHFFFHGDAPAFPLANQVTTILDLIPLKFPELYSNGFGGLRFKLARFLENRAAISARGIITISEATKRDVIDILGIPADNILVTPLGVDSKFFILPNKLESRVQAKESNRRDLGFEANDILLTYVGGIDPRKNIPFLISVFNEAKKTEGLKTAKLVLSGPYEKDKHLPALLNIINRSPYKDDIKLLGFIEDEKLLKLLLASEVFLFPSLYEGFGLPIIEAMAAGLPVISGGNSSLPEVLGDAGILAEDNNITSWVNKLIELTARINSQESVKAELQDALILNAKRFTWRKTAEDTIEAYNYFLDSKNLFAKLAK